MIIRFNVDFLMIQKYYSVDLNVLKILFVYFLFKN